MSASGRSFVFPQTRLARYWRMADPRAQNPRSNLLLTPYNVLMYGSLAGMLFSLLLELEGSDSESKLPSTP